MASVLLIEDDDFQRQYASLALSQSGHQVREAANGEEGLAAARQFRPDVVVCDVVMPRMNGYQVVSAIRANKELAATPVILLTSLSERAHMRLGMTSGADDFLN